jgi:hypothetical protein
MAYHKDPMAVENQMKRLLLIAAPPDEQGRKTITTLAKKLGVSRGTVWKWIEVGRIPPRRAVAVVDVSEGRVTLADFARFVYT